VTGKPLRLRPRARRDIAEIASYYDVEAGEPVANAFANALERAFRHIADHPASGSPRFAHETRIVGLRTWRLRRFPHLVFYLEHPDHVEIVRILHGKRDVALWLGGANDET
jgi:toxin ParE1/3/4